MTLYSILKTAYLPYHCILCVAKSTRKQDLCQACHKDLLPIPHSCPRCAKIITAHEKICGACLTENPPFAITHAAYLYASPISNLILELKFCHALVNARILGELLIDKIMQWYKSKALPQVIIPVPLHAKRLSERGFNQATEIARPIAHTLKIPLLVSSCSRIKNTQPQATLAIKERSQNIKSAFAVTKKLPYNHIVVIDDVITSGNTITEFCKTLKKTGVERIDIWCCAKPTLG